MTGIGRRRTNGRINGLRIAAGYAWRRVLSRKAEFATSACGIGLGVAGLVVLVFLPSITGERTLRTTLQQLPVEQRTVTLVIAGERTLTQPEVDAATARLRTRFAGSGLEELRHVVSFRALAAADGTVFRLGGAENFASAFRVVSGQAPATCTTARCEVVEVIGEAGTSVSGPSVSGSSVSGPSVSGPSVLRNPIPELLVVGRAVRSDPSVFTGGLAPEAGEVLLVADGTEGVDALPAIRLIRRVHAWLAPVDPATLTSDRVAPLLQTLAAASGDIDTAGFAITAPDAEINEAVTRSHAAARALALPAGELGSLVVAAVVLVGLGRRSNHQRASDRLSRRGARRHTTRAFAGVDAALVLLVGLGIGFTVGALIVASLAAQAGMEMGHAFGAARQVPALIVAALMVMGAWVVLLCVLLFRDRPPAMRRVRSSDVAGLASAATLALLLSRGSTSASGLEAAPDAAMWAIPVLGAVIYAAVCARIVPPLLRAAGGVVARRRRLEGAALSEAATNPAAPLAFATSVMLAVTFACFGLSYRATLLRSIQDQATFAVPYDATLSVASTLVRPMAVMPPDGWGSLAAAGSERTSATEVLRRSASVYRSGADPEIVEVLALDPRTLPAVRPWRTDFGPPGEGLAKQLSVSPSAPIGEVLPGGTRALRLVVAGDLASAGLNMVVLSVVVERADGTWHEEVAEWIDSGDAVATLGRDDEGARLIGFRVSQPPETAKRQEHHAGEGKGTAVDATGVTVDITRVQALSSSSPETEAAGGSIQVDTRRPLADVPLHAEHLASSVAILTVLPGGGLRVRVELQGTAALIVPRVDVTPIPVLVDPITASAAESGALVVETLGESFEFMVVAVATRFPTLGERFIVADIGRLSQRFNLVQPTYGTPTEVWLAAPVGRETQLGDALSDARFASVAVSRRADRVQQMRSDPIGKAALGVLWASTLLGAVLAAVAAAINVRRERSDDAPFHRALLLDGATPGLVRRLLWVRSLALVSIAVPLGLAGGLCLARLVVGAVALTSTAAQSQPPLTLTLPWLHIAGVVLALASATAVVAVFSARSAPMQRGPELLRAQRD